jgi:NAD-dependent deacetylase
VHSGPALERARQRLAQASNVAVLTGAGISAESGIPTFRDAQAGLWAQYDPMQLASEQGFRRDPALVWRWYAARRERVVAAQPNPGHLALAQAESRFAQFHLITQNVDGLHRRAGSRNVNEIHGNILRTVCLGACGFVEDDPSSLPPGEPPRCPACGEWLRPGVIWFGQALDSAALSAADEAAAACDLMLVVGTSGLVYPAAGLPARARAAGAAIIVVNLQASELDGIADDVLRGPAATVLPALLTAD